MRRSIDAVPGRRPQTSELLENPCEVLGRENNDDDGFGSVTTVSISLESFKELRTSPEYFLTPGGPRFIFLFAILRADFSAVAFC